MNVKNFIPMLWIFLPFSLLSQGVTKPEVNAGKIAGLNLVSMDRMMDSSEMLPIANLNANWSAVIPYAFVRDLHRPELSFNSTHQWVGERVEGVVESIHLLHACGIKVMIKPQIWVGHGDFTGHIEMYTDSAWQILERGYTDYILTYARLAEEEGAEMLCIGTELALFVSHRPAYWKKLIEDVRAVYSGKITYAENWDSYANVPFWSELDYIGIDAYFPLAKGKNPRLRALKSAWKPIRENLEELATHAERPVIFTEYGYRSTARCAEEPWNYRESDQESEKAQYHALLSLYETVWSDVWFQGGFLWKWYPDHEGRHHGSDHYTVQHKKAEELVRCTYDKCAP